MKTSPTSPDPCVTIVLVNWNGRGITLECLASLTSVSHPCHILVVDNGSRDGSVNAIRQAFPGVEILRLESNRGFAGGMNAGIAHALGAGADLLCLMNNDTTVDPGFLGHLVARFFRTPGAAAVAPKIFYAAERDRLWYAGAALSFWTGTARHIGIREVDRGQYDTPCETAYATGCCFLTRREVLQSVGTFDESYTMYAEDVDWSLRARERGYTILYEPSAMIWHTISVSAGGHLSWFKLKNKFLGNFRVVARHARWYHWLCFPWLSVLTNAVAAVRYLLTAREPRGDR